MMEQVLLMSRMRRLRRLLLVVMVVERLLVMLKSATHRPPRPRHSGRRRSGHGSAGVRRHPAGVERVRTGGLADGEISRSADPRRRRRVGVEVRPICQMSRRVTFTTRSARPTPR